MVWITRPAGDWHPAPDDHTLRGLHSGGLAMNLVCAEQIECGASERNDVGEGRKWDWVKALIRLGTYWDAWRSEVGPDYVALRAQGWLLEKRRAGKRGRFMDGYVCGQVSFAEVCGLVSRRKSLESSGPQLGVGSEAFPSIAGQVSALRDPTALSVCLYQSTNLIILTSSVLGWELVEQSISVSLYNCPGTWQRRKTETKKKL